MKDIKVIVAEANKEPYVKEIKDTMDEIYGLVYYPYKQIEIQKDIFLIYSKEATERKDVVFKENKKIKNLTIYGTFIIVKKKNNKLVSLPNEYIKAVLDSGDLNINIEKG